jgi:hypothetical protein
MTRNKARMLVLGGHGVLGTMIAAAETSIKAARLSVTVTSATPSPS